MLFRLVRHLYKKTTLVYELFQNIKLLITYSFKHKQHLKVLFHADICYVFPTLDHIFRKVECIDYPELGMEAVWQIEVVDFPAFILVDDKGNDFFRQLM